MKLFKGRPVFMGFFIIVSTGLGSLFGLSVAMYHDLPEVRALEEYRPNVVSRILAEDGTELAELFLEKRIWISYSDLPEHLIEALIATEDHKFFEHKGIRFFAILRALLVDIRMGRMAQGGSTITQQLAKQLFLSPNKKLWRKIKEALLAIQIEKRYTKVEILELYSNQIYLGSGAYGVAAAAQVYFGKSARDLTLAESAMIAGLPRAPSRYSPINNINLAKQRRATVLSRMAIENFITKEQEETARAEPIELVKRTDKERLAKHFVEMVRIYLEERYGSERLYREGLTVVTTLNPEMQRSARRAVAEGLKRVNNTISSKRLYPDAVSAQAALIAIRPEDGAIVAMIGGADYEKSQFNRAVNAKRQPGSGFKPFVYLAALDTGFTAVDKIIDSPVSFPGATKHSEWKPVNFSKRFYGPVSLRRALEFSINVATVKLLDKIGVDQVISVAKRMGITSKLRPYLSLALGVNEVSPLEITAAYSALANNGLYAKPYFIVSVENAKGKVLEERMPEVTDAIRPEVAYVLTKLLQGVIENGTGKVAKSIGRPVAGKTGTTNDFRDAWFLGYTPSLAAGVWVGFDDNRSLGPGETGGFAAGPIFASFMSQALKNRPVLDFTPPERVVVKVVDRESGKLATDQCRDTYPEVFIEGTEPVEYCVMENDEEERL
ncbi:Multimodular transpeptidase-transglycosylase [hydrothermal vent metagenome]|uniref:peptidoglycan glycosyltransferase n=1 Tax=hydrothermal vent metagenome TaxID=652676 RepID=A0A3B1CMP6_9ZZZZ